MRLRSQKVKVTAINSVPTADFYVLQFPCRALRKHVYGMVHPLSTVSCDVPVRLSCNGRSKGKKTFWTTGWWSMLVLSFTHCAFCVCITMNRNLSVLLATKSLTKFVGLDERKSKNFVYCRAMWSAYKATPCSVYNVTECITAVLCIAIAYSRK